MTRRARRHAGDEGSVLLMAIGFVLLFGILASILLDATALGLRESNQNKIQRRELYTSGGAVDVGIRAAVDAFNAGVSPGPLPSGWTCPNVTLDATASEVNDADASVVCTVTGTSTTADVPNTYPGDAVFTTTGGVTVEKKGTAIVAGNVVSGAGVEVKEQTGVLSVQGLVSAKACTGKGSITTTGTKVCNRTTATTDPGYTRPVPTPGSPALPACSSAVVTFSPGTYNNADALNAMFNGMGSCKGKEFHFLPGVYLFSFTAGAAREWKIKDAGADVVAGTAAGTWSTSASRPPIPGGCEPGTSSPNPGVTFVFAANSRLKVERGSFELCPPPPSAGQRLGIVGDVNQTGTVLKVEDKARAAIRGTVYAPNGVVELKTSNAATSTASRGIVARSLKIQASPVGIPAVSLPTTVAQADTEAIVRLVASMGGEPKVQADVVIRHTPSGTTYSVVAWRTLV